jgi:hypothetical protein
VTDRLGSGDGVVLDVDYLDGVFELVLVNLGREVAHDVRVEFSHPLIGLGGQIDLSTAAGGVADCWIDHHPRQW